MEMEVEMGFTIPFFMVCSFSLFISSINQKQAVAKLQTNFRKNSFVIKHNKKRFKKYFDLYISILVLIIDKNLKNSSN